MSTCHNVYCGTMYSNAVRCTATLIEYHAGILYYYSGVGVACILWSNCVAACYQRVWPANETVEGTLVPVCAAHFPPVRLCPLVIVPRN